MQQCQSMIWVIQCETMSAIISHFRISLGLVVIYIEPLFKQGNPFGILLGILKKYLLSTGALIIQIYKYDKS